MAFPIAAQGSENFDSKQGDVGINYGLLALGKVRATPPATLVVRPSFCCPVPHPRPSPCLTIRY